MRLITAACCCVADFRRRIVLVGSKGHNVRKPKRRQEDIGSIERNPGQGRPRAMAARDDHLLLIIAKRNRGATASQLSRYLYAATGTCVSRVTVSKRLHETKLFARRPAV
ncbi:HTH_Tnp_Tc3_2 domain-containing protein [Trichonephila clavipes]|nr:HTH_Tnp_Tc3_2 domain-containing protein [Trichonephila clavipes]